MKNYFSRYCRFITSLIFYGIWLSLSAAHDYQFKFDRLLSENVKYEKGLSQNWIYSIIQDSYGFMWFGTWDGLNKYDGYTFTIYNREHGLSNQTVNALFEDRQGYIWIGTDEGLTRYDRNTDTFTSFYHDPEDPNSLLSDRVTSIIGDDQGYLWIGTRNGLNRFDPETEKMESFLDRPFSTGIRSNTITCLAKDQSGWLWVGTWYGLVKMDPVTQQATRFYHKPDDPRSLSHNRISSIFVDRQNTVWIGTRMGINCYEEESGTFTKNLFSASGILSSSNITAIYEDSKGLLWIGTDGEGAFVFDRQTGRLENYQNNLNNQLSLSNDRIFCIFEDNSNSIWIGTFMGVNKIDRYENNFILYQRTAKDESSLNSNIVWSIYENENDNLWIGTFKGINILNRKTGRYRVLQNIPGNPNSLINNNVRCIMQDSRGYYWLGTYGGGLDRYDASQNEFRHFQVEPDDLNSLPSNYISKMYEDNNGLFWIGTGRGFCSYDPVEERFSNHQTVTQSPVFDIQEDASGKLWLATMNGLIELDKQTGAFRRHKHEKGDPNSLSHDYTFCVFQDKDGIIWIGTSGGGLNRFDKNTGVFEHYTTEDGLPNNVVYGILEDDSGSLWLSTNGGLTKFIKDKQQFVNYDVKDGIQSNEFNVGAFFKSDDGEMFFGGMNGFNSFYPSQIKTNTNIPDIVITSLKVFNKEIRGELFNNDTVVLQPDDNFFSFEFSALDFTNPSKNQYKYMLENIDKDWVTTDANRRVAEYTKIPPGTYQFNVTGSNDDGFWNQEGITVTLIIPPAWYETWLFRIFAALLIVGIAWYLIYFTIKRIRKKHEVEKKVLDFEKQLFDLEQKALRLQMNPHFIFNSLNSIQSFIVAHDLKTAIGYLAKFSKLMRLILANSIHKYIPLKDEITSITYYMDLEKLRFDNKFDYSITIDPEIDEDFIEIPPMIIQPYVENAIIHGLLHKKNKGHININFATKNSSILCTIKDDGIGREAAAKIRNTDGLKRKSRGMLITQSRLEILNRKENLDYSVHVNDLKDDNQQPAGTEVSILIHFKDS